MTFSEQKFNDRFRPGGMGDEAEGIFEEVYPRGWAPKGLRRPPISLAKVPAFYRYEPDYITSHGLVEVQGFGWDQTAKFKTEKVEVCSEHHRNFPVTWFLWDKKNKRYGYVPHLILVTHLEHFGIEGAFDNGKNPYLSLHADELPVDEWIPYEAQPSRSR